MRLILGVLASLVLVNAVKAETFECKIVGTSVATNVVNSEYVQCISRNYSYSGVIHNYTPIESIKVKVTEYPINGAEKVRELNIPVNQQGRHGLYDVTLMTTRLVREAVIGSGGWEQWQSYMSQFKKDFNYEVVSYIISHNCMMKSPTDKNSCFSVSPKRAVDGEKPDFMP